MNKSTVSIRKAKLKDLPRLAELGIALLKYHQKFDPYFAPARDARATYLKYFRSCVYSRKKLLLVAESENKIIGYSLANLGTRPPVFQIRKIGHLNDMYIEDNFRGQGLSKKLLAETYKWFRKHKISNIHLTYHSKNQSGGKAWGKHGFEEYMRLARVRL